MGDGMPYHLEKGPRLRILESVLNRDREGMLQLLDRLDASHQDDSLDWIVDSEVWQDAAFARAPESRDQPPGTVPGDAVRRRLISEWFGFKDDGRGGWEPDPAALYWTGYRGDVHRIVRTAIRWAVELALASGSDDRAAADVEPWPIELLWKCPAPWFEAWVVSRRSGTSRNGLVTVVFVTPSHSGASVAESPVAHSEKTLPDGASFPVPSRERDYELLGDVNPHTPPPVPARQRDFAMWVVTHRDNVIADPPVPETGDADVDPDEALADRRNTAIPRNLFSWDIPQLATYQGTGDVVVVSPSMAAGGIKHDGSV
jgi:hypothetical protein